MLASVTFVLVLVVLALQMTSLGASPSPSNQRKARVNAFPKVVGGTSSSRGRFPYMCSLRRRGDRGHVCGGTLIKRQWVLTAAHCVDPLFDGSTGLSVLIYCGIYERNERNPNKVFAADRTFIHPEWTGNLLEGYDIALIKLDAPFDSPLPDLEALGNVHKSGTVFSALGWGLNSRGVFSDLLQIAARIVFVTKNVCNQANYWDKQIKDFMICAGIGEQDTAGGDSGGPLLLVDIPNGDYAHGNPSYDLLVGITSFGGGPDRRFVPGVYTRVGYFRDWIDCIVEEKENCSNDGRKTTESTVAANSQSSPTIKASSVSPERSEGYSGGRASSVRQLLDSCLDITPQRDFNETRALQSIRTAIRKDDSETVEELLCKGLTPNTSFSVSSLDANWTLLHEAAKHDAVKSATVLIENGVSIEKPTERHHRPLHTAAHFNSVKVAKLLIKSGADVEAASGISGHPLHVAALYNSDGVAEVLIDSGASVESKTFYTSTPLHLAAERNSLAIAELLISKGANVESLNSRNEKPLHYAAKFNTPEVAKVLTDAGANYSSVDLCGDTPLHFAAKWGSLDVAQVLVDGGAQVDVKNSMKQTPLHYAVVFNHLKIAQKGASKRAKDDEGNAPFDTICASSTCKAQEFAALQRLLRN